MSANPPGCSVIDHPDAALIPHFTPGAAYVVDVMWKNTDRFLRDLGLELDLNPDFQRVHVWGDLKRRRYIEYILRGGLTAKELLFNACGWRSLSANGPLVLVDGKQRLEAVRRFLADELPIFGGWKLSDFADQYRLLRGHQAGFRIHINDLETRKEVLEWYLDINAGGVAHTDYEIGRVESLLKDEP